MKLRRLYVSFILGALMFLPACGGDSAKSTHYLQVTLSVEQAISFATTTASFDESELSFIEFVNDTDEVLADARLLGSGEVLLTFLARESFGGQLGKLVFRIKEGNGSGVTVAPFQVGLDAAEVTVNSEQVVSETKAPSRGNPEDLTDTNVSAKDIAYSGDFALYDLGDLDQSGKVDLADVALLKDIIFAEQTADDFRRYHSDLLLDEKIDFDDLVHLSAKATGRAPPQIHAAPREFRLAKGEQGIILVGNSGKGRLPEVAISTVFGQAPLEITRADQVGRVFQLTGRGQSQSIGFVTETAGSAAVLDNQGLTSVTEDEASKAALRERARKHSAYQMLEAYLLEQKFTALGSEQATTVSDDGGDLVSFLFTQYQAPDAPDDKAYLVYGEDGESAAAYVSVMNAQHQAQYDLWVNATGGIERNEGLAVGNLSVSAACYTPQAFELELQQSACESCKRNCKEYGALCTVSGSLICLGIGAGIGTLPCIVATRWLCISGMIKCDINCENGPCNPSPPCVSCGDPHLTSFDGLAYDFQAAGEFLLASSESGDFVLQARQEPWGSSTRVSINTAAAMNVRGDRVGIYASKSPALYINGRATELTESTLTLPQGGTVRHSASGYLIRWPDGTVVSVSGNVRSIRAQLSETRRDGMTGLLGNFDGDRTNDIVARDGSVFEAPLAFEDLYGAYGNSWRLSQAESLFDYDAGKTTDSYTVPEFPSRYVSVADLSEAQYQTARSVCEAAGITDPVVLEQCILDVGLTGDESFASDFDTLATDLTVLPVSVPVYLDGWEQTGVLTNGVWTVAEDGRSVLQTVNGDPTFFVSQQDYVNTTIRGKFKVETTGDDDLIGFVFGYNAPLGEDNPNSFDLLLLDWKQSTQGFGEGRSEEGFTLARVKGLITDYNPGFWGHQDSPEFQILGTDYGEEKGWQDNVEHAFELRYSETKLKVFVDGDLIFDIDGSFPKGRFGFYNYSQSSVRYYNFSASSD